MLDATLKLADSLREIAPSEMGAEDYLAKPFDPVLLRARIGASLEKKRLRDRERGRTAVFASSASGTSTYSG